MFTNLLEYKEAAQLHDSLLKIQYHFEITGKKCESNDIENDGEMNGIEMQELERVGTFLLFVNY